MALLPMFPLGTVLFPGMFLPLHVFEPRYRRLTADCLAGDREFGVVLIERGSEVGGGDVRTMLGTVARIVDARESADGRWALACVGDRRITIDEWLDDDPYPRAAVSDLADGEALPGTEQVDALRSSFRRVVALASELGAGGIPGDFELADDPAVATFQVGALAPFGPLDRQRVLCGANPAARCTDLLALLDDAAELLTAELGRSED